MGRSSGHGWYRHAIVVAVVAVTMLSSPLAGSLGANSQAAATLEDDGDGEIEIVRDQYGVPHVYGETDEDVAFGAGYALAEDRLWQMHVLRLAAKADLSEWLGPAVVGSDRGVAQLTYTSEERLERFETYPEDLQDMLRAFADGINERIEEVRQDPSQIPFEFVHFGLWPIEDWHVDDSIALQDLLILSFGAGGGNEMAHAALLDQLLEEHDEETATAMFDDLVPTVDPDAPVTVPPEHDYTEEPNYVRDAEAEAHRALTDDARLGLDADDAQVQLPGPDETSHPDSEVALGALEQLELVEDPQLHWENMQAVRDARQLLDGAITFGSNAIIVGPQLSETGNTLHTAGPQVGYSLPQWLSDFGLHSEEGELDATGMTFAGAGPAVLIGTGDGYGWTTTTGSSDLTDSYVVELNPEDHTEYRYDGEWRPMDCRTKTHTFRGIPFETQEICRTHHGPVVSVDEDNDQAVALRMAWYDREGQTVEGFFGYNSVDSIEDFGTEAGKLASNHNMFYTDDQGNYGFWHPGNHPLRADGTDLRMPQDGSTSATEWQGLVPLQETPHAVNFDRGWLVNWNNMPAEDWPRERSWDTRDNADTLTRAVDPDRQAPPDPHGGLVNPDREGLDYHDLDANLRYAAFKDHQDTWYRPLLPAEEDLDEPLAEDALAAVQASDAFLTDRDDDGGQDTAAPTIVDAWIDTLHGDVFAGQLGDQAGWAGEDRLLWQVLSPDSEFELSHDWLGSEDPAQVRAEAFETAVEGLAEEFDSEDPEDWRRDAPMYHYQRLNAHLAPDLAEGTLGLDRSGDRGLPGDVPDHIRMDRGTYNHIVHYQEQPTEGPTWPDELDDDDEADFGELGHAERKAGSVIPPGQSGHIDVTGQEDEHYRDQLDLYVDWAYKPMPMTKAESTALAESIQTLERG